VFTGKGQMSIKQTLQPILPPEIVLLFLDAKLDSIISWNIKNQKRSNILNELASRFNFEWNRIDYRLLITEKSLGTFTKATSQTSFNMGLNAMERAETEKVTVSDQKIPGPNTKNEKAALLLAKNDALQFMGINSLKDQSSMKTPKNGDQELQGGKTQTDGQSFASFQSDLQLLSLRPASNLSKLEGSSPPLKLPPNASNRFEVPQEDETLSIAFKRWSTQEGYQLIWDAEKDFAAIQTVYPLESLEEAIFHVMKDIENSDYPLHACIYKNKVLRIIPMSKVCDRQRGVVRE